MGEYKLLITALLECRLLVEDAVRNGQLKAEDGIRFDRHRDEIIEIVKKALSKKHGEKCGTAGNRPDER